MLRGLKEAQGDGSLAWAHAEKAEAICKSSLSDEQCVEDLIWCWGYALRIAKVENDEAFDVVMARLRTYTQAFPNSDTLASAFARALDLRGEVIVEARDSDTMEERLLSLASQMETMAREMPDFANVQWSRAGLWLDLALAWVKDGKRGLRIGAIARDVDEFTQPFPFHLLQGQRISIWQQLANYESRHGVAPEEAERIARRITLAAEPFHSNEGVLSSVAWAWECAVFGWHRDTRAWKSCERALRHLQVWLAESPSGVDGACAHVSAWGLLLNVHRQRRDFDAFARLEPEALDCAESARAAYPDNEDIAEYAGYVIAQIASGRWDRTAGRAAIEEMTTRIQTLTDQFPHSENLQENSALANRLLHGLATNTPPASPADAQFGASVSAPRLVQFGSSHQDQNPQPKE